MRKFVIVCPKCHKKMKISDKLAKYKCPHCGEIYRYHILKKIYYNIKNVITGLFQTVKDIGSNIKRRYNNAVSTYKYMSQLRKNMKNDPNWSQYRTQQREEKDVTPKKSFMDSLKEKFKRR